MPKRESLTKKRARKKKAREKEAAIAKRTGVKRGKLKKGSFEEFETRVNILSHKKGAHPTGKSPKRQRRVLSI